MSLSETAAAVDNPEQLVRDFLGAMQARDLATAKSFLAPGFTMTFPGPVTFGDFEGLISWASDRYLHVGKKFDRFDTAHTEDGAVVYCYGTLYGQWLDGSDFDGIRFIDRFTVRDGKLIDQLVWNDMGEVRAGQGTADG